MSVRWLLFAPAVVYAGNWHLVPLLLLAGYIYLACGFLHNCIVSFIQSSLFKHAEKESINNSRLPSVIAARLVVIAENIVTGRNTEYTAFRIAEGLNGALLGALLI
jgi:hypothetical protein